MHCFVWVSGFYRILKLTNPSQISTSQEYGVPPTIFYVSLDVMSNIFLVYSTYLFWAHKTTFEWMFSISSNPVKSNDNANIRPKTTWMKSYPYPKIFLTLTFFAISFMKGVDLILMHNLVTDNTNLSLYLGLVPFVMIVVYLHFSNMIFAILCTFVKHRVDVFIEQLRTQSSPVEVFI